MKVTGIKSERVNIEIADREITDIIINKIHKAFNIPTQTWINNEGILMKWTEYHTSHSWTEDTVVREATEEDKAAFLVMSKLKELDKT